MHLQCITKFIYKSVAKIQQNMLNLKKIYSVKKTGLQPVFWRVYIKLDSPHVLLVMTCLICYRYFSGAIYSAFISSPVTQNVLTVVTFSGRSVLIVYGMFRLHSVRVLQGYYLGPYSTIGPYDLPTNTG